MHWRGCWASPPSAKRQLLLLARGYFGTCLYPELFKMELCYPSSAFCKQHQNCQFRLPLFLPTVIINWLSSAALPTRAGSPGWLSLKVSQKPPPAPREESLFPSLESRGGKWGKTLASCEPWQPPPPTSTLGEVVNPESTPSISLSLLFTSSARVLTKPA